MSRPTLQDVANHAGVSAATVSRVVNGRTSVASTTRADVLEAIAELGYVPPTRMADRSGGIGVILPELSTPIFGRWVVGLEAALAAVDRTAIIGSISPLASEHSHIQRMLDASVEAIVFILGHHTSVEMDHAQYERVASAGVAMGFVGGTAPGVAATRVASDDAVGTRLAVQHLADLGHERIGLAVGPRRYRTTQRRIDGFAAARGRLDLDIDLERDVTTTSYSVEGGARAAELHEQRGCTALVCGSDLMALGAIRHIRDREGSVPQDMSVVGHDDTRVMEFTDPPLTTLREDVEGMSRHVVHGLMDQLAGIEPTEGELLFRPSLVLRGSTGPAPTGTRG